MGRVSLTCEELSVSSMPWEEVERVSSDWPLGTPLIRPFSKRPRPLLLGGDESESLASTPCSSVTKPNIKKEEIGLRMYTLPQQYTIADLGLYQI